MSFKIIVVDDLKDFAMKKAIESMDKARKKAKIKMTNKEIRRFRDFGRK